MNLSNLKPAKGSVNKRKRIGRGEGSGRGGQSTRGHKGAQSRSDMPAKWALKEDRCPCSAEFPSLIQKQEQGCLQSHKPLYFTSSS